MAIKIQDGRRRPQDINFHIHLYISHTELNFLQTSFSVEYIKFLNITLLFLLCTLQTSQICFLHRPGFSPICKYTLDTSTIYFSLNVVWYTPSCQYRRYLLELSPSISHTGSCSLLYTSSCTNSVAQIAELGNTFQLHIGLNHKLFQQNWLTEVILSLQTSLAI